MSGHNLPAALSEPLRLCASGALPANVAVMRLVIGAARRADVDGAIALAVENAEGEAADRLTRARVLWTENPQAWDTIKSVLERIDNARRTAPGGAIGGWTAAFDAAWEASPSGGVALYALGNDALLEVATAEIVDLLFERGFAGRDDVALDLGCGTGRIAEALAARLRAVAAVDLSPAMAAAARRRCARLPNVDVRVGSATNLHFVADNAVDLALAVDSFPFIVDAGPEAVAAAFREAARMLRLGGRLVILNYS